MVAEAGKKEGETYYLIGCELPPPPRDTVLLWLLEDTFPTFKGGDFGSLSIPAGKNFETASRGMIPSI